MDTHARVLELLRREGIEMAAVAPADPLPAAREAATTALDAGHLQGMDWITAAWLSRSTDPQKFLPGCRSIILVALPCHAPDPVAPPGGPARGRIARYARGRDYHRVFEKALRRVARELREEFDAGARATVDYGPLLERSFASRAGLGWLGKSTMLLVPGFGPWVLLGAIATSLDLPAGQPVRKTCGSCTRCIVACPTDAIDPAGNILDSRRCISYHTIENRGPIPRELRASFGDWIFGCDLCLDACPVGLSRFDAHPDFVPATVDYALPPLTELLDLDETAFQERFQGRPITRAKRDGFLRNVCIALGNTGAAGDLKPLTRALEDSAPLVRGHAAWAVARLAVRTGCEPAARIALQLRLDSEHDPLVREEIVSGLTTLA